MTEPDHTDPPHGHIQSPSAHVDAPRPLKHAATRWGAKLSMPMRLLLLGLGIGGTLAATGAWAGGHGGLAIRVLAGDIVLIAVALLVS